jgi:hypothetical protein
MGKSWQPARFSLNGRGRNSWYPDKPNPIFFFSIARPGRSHVIMLMHLCTTYINRWTSAEELSLRIWFMVSGLMVMVYGLWAKVYDCLNVVMLDFAQAKTMCVWKHLHPPVSAHLREGLVGAHLKLLMDHMYTCRLLSVEPFCRVPR